MAQTLASEVGTVAHGLCVPKTVMNAAQVAEATCGKWTGQAIKEKLGR